MLETRACHFQKRLCFDAQMPYAYRQGSSGSPLFVFLHGAGEKGCAAQDLINSTCEQVLKTQQPDWHLLQCCCPAGVASWPRETVHACIQDLCQTFHIKQTILAGISMGARGVYEIAYEYSAFYHAYICIAGFGIPNLAPQLEQKPVWLAHGQHDDTVPLARAHEMQQALMNAHLQVYEQLGHNCLDTALGDHKLWQWLGQALNK